MGVPVCEVPAELFASGCPECGNNGFDTRYVETVEQTCFYEDGEMEVDGIGDTFEREGFQYIACDVCATVLIEGSAIVYPFPETDEVRKP